eukprot:608147-Pyramimonas_sp.AAC.1
MFCRNHYRVSTHKHVLEAIASCALLLDRSAAGPQLAIAMPSWIGVLKVVPIPRLHQFFVLHLKRIVHQAYFQVRTLPFAHHPLTFSHPSSLDQRLASDTARE